MRKGTMRSRRALFWMRAWCFGGLLCGAMVWVDCSPAVRCGPGTELTGGVCIPVGGESIVDSGGRKADEKGISEPKNSKDGGANERFERVQESPWPESLVVEFPDAGSAVKPVSWQKERISSKPTSTFALEGKPWKVFSKTLLTISGPDCFRTQGVPCTIRWYDHQGKLLNVLSGGWGKLLSRNGAQEHFAFSQGTEVCSGSAPSGFPAPKVFLGELSVRDFETGKKVLWRKAGVYFERDPFRVQKTFLRAEWSTFKPAPQCNFHSQKRGFMKIGKWKDLVASGALKYAVELRAHNGTLGIVREGRASSWTWYTIDDNGRMTKFLESSAKFPYAVNQLNGKEATFIRYDRVSKTFEYFFMDITNGKKLMSGSLPFNGTYYSLHGRWALLSLRKKVSLDKTEYYFRAFDLRKQYPGRPQDSRGQPGTLLLNQALLYSKSFDELRKTASYRVFQLKNGKETLLFSNYKYGKIIEQYSSCFERDASGNCVRTERWLGKIDTSPKTIEVVSPVKQKLIGFAAQKGYFERPGVVLLQGEQTRELLLWNAKLRRAALLTNDIYTLGSRKRWAFQVGDKSSGKKAFLFYYELVPPALKTFRLVVVPADLSSKPKVLGVWKENLYDAYLLHPDGKSIHLFLPKDPKAPYGKGTLSIFSAP